MGTALHVAVSNIVRLDPELGQTGDRELEIFELLLDRGADLGALENRYTPFEKLISWGRRGSSASVTALKVLLDRRIELNETSESGRTPLNEALSASNVEAIRLLLDAGADAVAADAYGSTPLHVAANYAGEGFLDDDATTVIGWLLEAGADIDARDAEGRTPCDMAMNRSTGHHQVGPAAMSLLCPQ